MDWTNFFLTVGASTVFAAGGTAAGIKYALSQNVKDHKGFKTDIDSLEKRLLAAEQSVLKVVTLFDEWRDRLKSIDDKLKTVCGDVSYLRGEFKGMQK